MGLKGYMLWVMGQLDSTYRAPPRRSGGTRRPSLKMQRNETRRSRFKVQELGHQALFRAQGKSEEQSADAILDTSLASQAYKFNTAVQPPDLGVVLFKVVVLVALLLLHHPELPRRSAAS
jgi:hypothetical protein